MSGNHDPVLVLLSILIAVAASYTSLDLAGRVRAAVGRGGSVTWLLTAALAMGGGIWSMHFVAMLAFAMPGMTVTYDPGLTILSLLLAIAVTGVGLALVSRPGSGGGALVVGGLFMGLGIVGMHYTGMAAMQMPMSLSYDPVWVGISIVIAVGAAIAALWLAFRKAGPLQKGIAAIAMGLAIAGMHYAGMQSLQYGPHPAGDVVHGHASFDQARLALAVAAITFLILFLALIAAMFDRRFALLVEKEAVALRRSEEQFRSLYRKTPFPLHALDQWGRIEEISDAWLDLLGYTRAEVIGRPLIDFMTSGSARQRRQTDWPKLMADGELLNMEYRFLTKSGTAIDVISSSRIERQGDGSFRTAVGGLVDVTARKRAEDALRQAQKMEAVGQLTGGVAHDFNNLLAVVLGNLELLRKRLPDDPKLIRLADNAIAGAARGSALTQRMLSFARQQSLQPEAIDIAQLVAGMEDLLQRSLSPQIRVETRFPAASIFAQADAHQLELALLNLAVNARDAMPDGGGLTISARQVDVREGDVTGLRSGAYICVSVKDEGEGMDEATLARAREPFFTTKGIAKGTGLGLSMVHGFAEQSGGTLVLDSSPGVGTTAQIWLPVAAWSLKSEPLARVVEAPRVSGTLSIMAVDDDALVLMNTVAMLEDAGHRVVSATSAREALDLLHKERVDIVITDYAMPALTGLQLATAIQGTYPGMPVLLATGYADIPGGSAIRLPRLGKPFTQHQLQQAIFDCLTATETAVALS